MIETTWNPFCVPGRTFEEPGPLTPWQQVAHSSYYAVVDHTEQAYQEFIAKLQGWNLRSNGGIVLVHGEDGCGKTSLIHRCASAVRDSFQQAGSIEIVDRSLERLDGQTAISKCDEVVRALLRHFRRTTGFLPGKDLKSLLDPPSKPDDSELRRIIEEVAEVLIESSRTVIVIPSKLELLVELQTYVFVFARRCLVLLMETSQEGMRQFVDRWNIEPANKEIFNLEVGPLEVEHGWVFVQSRLKEEVTGASVPEFDESAVTEYMRARSQNAKVSIRELERVCLRLFDDATRQSKRRIQYDDFADLWVRYGGALR